MKDVNDQAAIVITEDNASLDFPLFILTPLLYVIFLQVNLFKISNLYKKIQSLNYSKAQSVWFSIGK